MKHFFCLLFLLIIMIPGSTQDNIDSLRSVINDTNLSTSGRMQAMYALADHYQYSQPDSTLLFSKQHYELALKTNDKAEQGRALYILGKYHYNVGDYSTSEEVLQQGLVYCRAAGDSITAAGILLNLGFNYMDQGDYSKALDYYQQCLTIRIAGEDQRKVASVLANIGNVYHSLSDHEKALEYYRQSLEKSEATGNQNVMAYVLGNIGIIYADQGDYSLALDYFGRSLEMRKSTGNQSGIAACLNNIGNIYSQQAENEQALNYYKQSLDILKDIGNQLDINTALINIAKIYLRLDQDSLALDYADQCLGIAQQIGARLNEGWAFSIKGDIFLKSGQNLLAEQAFQQSLAIGESIEDLKLQTNGLLGLAKLASIKSNWRLCLDYASRGLKAAKAAGLSDSERDAAEILWKCHKELGQYAAAMESYQYFVLMRDSLQREENQRATFAFEYRQKALEDSLAMVQQQAEVEIAYQQRISQQRFVQRLIIAALVIALLLIGAIIWFNRLKQRVNNELKRLNEEISQQKEQLEQLDKLKSHFFANISHELRTPLTIIGGMAEQIEKDPEKWMNKGLEMIRRNNENLLNLVNQILDLRKLEAGAMTLDLIQEDILFYIRYITESFHSLAESKGIELNFISKEKELHMDYDQDKILRIVSNLLSNAIKYTPEKGNIYLSIERSTSITEDKTIQGKEFLLLEIRDTGMGIPAEKLPHIFDRFFQVDASSTRIQQGTGIGLALVRELVHLMEGIIEVTSEVNKGTTFHIKLPIRNEALKADLSEIRIEARSPLVEFSGEQTSVSETEIDRELTESAVNVLIIEDNPDVVSYLESLLQNHYKLDIARDGQSGIQQALENIPDLIISDVMMPGKNGLEVCEALKTHPHTSHIPFILLTAKADIDSKLEGLEQGADVYLPKPFHEKELLLNLRNLFAQRKKLQEYYASKDFDVVEATSANKPESYNPEDVFLATATRHVLEHLDQEDFGNDALGKALGMSESKLNRKIKALTGRTLSIFIRGVRLREGKKMLTTTELTISEIAYAVGFSDPAYFTRTFSSEFGQAPSTFRN